MYYECFIESLSFDSRAQIGFTPSSRTTDHIFTLKTPCNKYVKNKKGGKLFACFVDLKNLIWHKGLFHKLSTNQVNGQFLNIIQSMCKNSSSAVKLGNRCTQFFLSSKSLRQRCPSSQNLLDIYVNDLFETLNGVNTHPPCLSNEQITAFMYADDLIILSLSKSVWTN